MYYFELIVMLELMVNITFKKRFFPVVEIDSNDKFNINLSVVCNFVNRTLIFHLRQSTSID